MGILWAEIWILNWYFMVVQSLTISSQSTGATYGLCENVLMGPIEVPAYTFIYGCLMHQVLPTM